MRFVGRVVVHDGIDDLPGSQGFETVLNRNNFASGRKNRADPDQVVLGDSGVAKCELEGGKFFAMLPHAFGQKYCLPNRPHQLSSIFLIANSDFSTISKSRPIDRISVP